MYKLLMALMILTGVPTQDNPYQFAGISRTTTWRSTVPGTTLRCGDGYVSTNESCDDSNTTSGDGCSSSCNTEIGFRCTGSPSVCIPGQPVLPPDSALLYYRADDIVTGSIAGDALTLAGQGVATVPNRGSLTSADLTQATASARPYIENNCVGRRACFQLNGNAGHVEHMSSGAFTSIAQPFTACAVTEGAASFNRTLFSDNTTALGKTIGGAYGATGNIGGTGVGAISTGTFHTTSFDVVCALYNGASSKICVNGSCVSGNIGGTSNLGAFEFGCQTSACAAGQYIARVAEFGVWSGDNNITTRYYNYAKAYYGDPFPITDGVTGTRTNIYALGTSITFGTGDTAASGWAARLQGMLGDSFNITIDGAGGRLVSQMYTQWTNNVKNHGYKYLLIEGPGINDVLTNSTAASTIYSTIKTLCQEARADTSGSPSGITVEIATVTPSNAYSGWTSGKQAIFDTLRSTELASLSTDCPGVILVDVHNATGDSSDSEKLGTWTGTSDGLHPGPAGHQAIATKFLHP